jgi:hypothetical protein
MPPSGPSPEGAPIHSTVAPPYAIIKVYRSEGSPLQKEKLLEAMFRLTEYLINFELGNRARRLIVYYFNQSRNRSVGGRAREAVERYCQLEIPMVTELRNKPREELDIVDHLVLQLEHEAKQFAIQYPGKFQIDL